MQQLADLELPFLAVEQPDFATDPFKHFAAAREVHPWLARTAFGYVVTQYRAMREMIVHESKLMMGLTDPGTDWRDAQAPA